jgi:plastocyanin
VSLGALACSESTAPSDDADSDPSADVSVQDNRFVPPEASASVGEAVTWSWDGANPHNVTFDDAEVGSSATQTSGTFSRTFDDAGEYTYFCTVHGRAIMSGRVVVGG